MKAVIMTLGTRGDVQPYVALGQELTKRGHDVIICTGESFKGFIEEHGITFARAESDLMALLKTPEGQAVFNSAGKNIVKTLKYVKEVVTPAFRKSLDDFWEAAKEADVIIYHPKAFGTVDMALALGIPCISMPPVPIIYPITEFPNLAIAPTRNWGKLLNKLSYKLIEKADASNIKEINDFRKKTLHLAKRKAGVFAYKKDGVYIPIIYPLSPALFTDVKSWENRVFLPGFFFLDTKELTLDKKIEDFLSKGKKPIIISFSSMPLKEPEVFKEKLTQALKRTDNRAIILTGTSGMQFTHENCILAVGQAPHSLLFPKAMGIVHHGGIGTVAAALCSGVPQLIIPFSADQPFWANRLYKMGYALKPLREKNCNVQDLVLAFQKMADITLIQNALAIKKIIEKEDGVISAVDYIEKICI
ncbi:MAG: glycosyltransferase [Anaerocolumna sp.]